MGRTRKGGCCSAPRRATVFMAEVKSVALQDSSFMVAESESEL